MKHDDPRLKVGAIVHCPADRGDPPYTGRIEHISPGSDKPVPYVWVTVRKSQFEGGTAHVWPSNRLG